jgi:L-glutamine-phosphate cytidylyltransferase
MGTLTEDLPKGMLSINGRTLIERQLEALRNAGLNDIVIVTGYQAEKIGYAGIRYCHNPEYATTNMIESLLCARSEMTDDIMVAYSDIIYTSELAHTVASSSCDIGVAVDEAWRDYWLARYDTTETDLESLSVSENGLITEIGKPVERSEGLLYRYIGLLKFSRQGLHDLLAIYDRKKAERSCWSQSGNVFEKGYMTDLMNEAIVSGLPVSPIITSGGWLEFDTEQDYARGCTLLNADEAYRALSGIQK